MEVFEITEALGISYDSGETKLGQKLLSKIHRLMNAQKADICAENVSVEISQVLLGCYERTLTEFFSWTLNATQNLSKNVESLYFSFTENVLPSTISWQDHGNNFSNCLSIIQIDMLQNLRIKWLF